MDNRSWGKAFFGMGSCAKAGGCLNDLSCTSQGRSSHARSSFWESEGFQDSVPELMPWPAAGELERPVLKQVQQLEQLRSCPWRGSETASQGVRQRPLLVGERRCRILRATDPDRGLPRAGLLTFTQCPSASCPSRQMVRDATKLTSRAGSLLVGAALPQAFRVLFSDI